MEDSAPLWIYCLILPGHTKYAGKYVNYAAGIAAAWLHGRRIYDGTWKCTLKWINETTGRTMEDLLSFYQQQTKRGADQETGG